jgi:O-antigen ligase
MDGAWNTPEAAGNGGAARGVVISGERVPRAARVNQLNRVFHYVLLVYLFMYFSRLPELLSWLRIGLIMQPILLIGLFMTDQVNVLTKLRPTRWLIALTIWVGLCVPFSVWPGGSVAAFMNTLQSLLLVSYILAFIRSLPDIRRAFTAVGLASGLIAIISFVSSADIDNRQGMGGSASLADPNFYALYLLVGGVFLCWVAVQKRGFMRFLAMALIPINLAGILRSGSRAGLLTLGVGIVIFLIRASAKQRTLVLSACAIGLLVSLAFLPQKIKTRFTTWLSPGGFSSFLSGKQAEPTEKDFDVNGMTSSQAASDEEITGSQASTEARLYLLRESLLLTAMNPIFGVGPGQFEVAEAAYAAKRGIKGIWHYTHNTYTQMSSECGIPGLVMFIGALFPGYGSLSLFRRHGPTRSIRQTALFLQTAYLMLMVGAFFLSLGYGGLPFVLIAFSGAFKRAVRSQVKRIGPQIMQQAEVSLAV